MLAGRPLDKSEHRQTARPVELEDWLNRHIYHRLSKLLARALALTFVTPNMVSVAGGVMVVLAGITYAVLDHPGAAVLGLLMHISWHVLDGADGDLARLTGQASEFGEMIDGLCDYLSHLALYLLLAWVLAGQIGPLGWVLMVATGLARIPQTVFYETQRRQYQWWAHGKQWLRISRDETPAKGAFGHISAFYLRLSAAFETGGRRLDATFSAATDAERELLRAQIRSQFRPLLGPLSLLSSNYRTLGIGFAMILGSPLYYVALELVALTLLTAVLMRRTGRAIARIDSHAEPSTLR